MKILCDRQQLQDVFGVAAGVAPLKAPKEIVKNALIETGDGQITVSATDFEMSAQITLDSVKVSNPGVALLPAKETHALLRELADPTVTIETEDLRSTITSAAGSFVLVGADPTEFPKKTELEKKGRSIRIAGAQLLEMVRRTHFAAAKDDSRYAINGVLLECKDSCLKMVATDGRRLSMCYHNLEGDVPDLRAIIPLRTLQSLSRAIQEGTSDEVTIAITKNQAGITLDGSGCGQTVLVTQLLDREFPDYEAVIPKVADTTIEISKAMLEANLRRVAVLSNNDVPLVRFQFSSSNLDLSAENAGIGRGDVALDVDVKGAGGSIGFNPDYVLEALKVCDLETVRLDMTDDETPAKFTLGESFTYVLMPVSST